MVNPTSSASTPPRWSTLTPAVSKRAPRGRGASHARGPEPAVSENQLSQKTSGFFARISDKYQTYKENRKVAYLQKSKTNATSEIRKGLQNQQTFAEVHRGLKRLHKAEKEFKNPDSSIGGFKKDTYVSDTLKNIAYTLGSEAPEAANLSYFVENREKLVNEHSDRNKLFHRILVGLAKIGLVRSSYLKAREERIDAMDSAIRESLNSMLHHYKETRTIEDMTRGVFHIGDKGYVRGNKEVPFKHECNLPAGQVPDRIGESYSEHIGISGDKSPDDSNASSVFTHETKLMFERSRGLRDRGTEEVYLSGDEKEINQKVFDGINNFTGSQKVTELLIEAIDQPGWNKLFAKMLTVKNGAGELVTFERPKQGTDHSVVRSGPTKEFMHRDPHDSLGKTERVTVGENEQRDFTVAINRTCIAKGIRFHNDKYLDFATERRDKRGALGIPLRCEFTISRDAANKGQLHLIDSKISHEFSGQVKQG